MKICQKCADRRFSAATAREKPNREKRERRRGLIVRKQAHVPYTGCAVHLYIV